ncbi:MAG: ABC transporter ATP-binding protein [Bacilli bacterium]|jgi:ABC-2 type transport system ATP-binding protein|nr:ABC transporter ATP-binding protein [Bacilli bacterium]MCX4254177.1 ABC transporter ATP-binding protein [Bacilli bacterium]
MSILKVENLCKKIGKKDILKDVSFEVVAGDIMAFIGPNGAGKTTTIKCVLGLQKITRGKVFINGYDISKNFVKAIEKVGSIVESPDVYMYMSGYDNLLLQARMYKNIKEEDIYKIIKLVGLENRIYDKVNKYSLGMRQRLGIAIALINNPKLLILDEPTNGLDPEGIKELRELLVELAKSGMGILISSHNLSELESFCNKVCILSHGELLEENTIAKIKEIDENKYIIKVSNLKKVLKFLNSCDRVIDDNYVEVIRDEKDIAKFIKELVNNNIDIFEVKKEELSLEEAFIRRAGGKKID